MNMGIPLIAWPRLNRNYAPIVGLVLLFRQGGRKMRSLLLAILTLAAAPAAAQDNLKLFSTDINVRTSLTFKVADTAVQRMLPAGWELNSPAAGPTKGFNLGVTLIDYVTVHDREGKLLPPRNI